MKCPKCGYTSFDYLEECKKCGEILDDCRKALNLKMSEPTLFADFNFSEEEASVPESGTQLAEEQQTFPGEEAFSLEPGEKAFSLEDEIAFANQGEVLDQGAPEAPAAAAEKTTDKDELDDLSLELGSLGTLDTADSPTASGLEQTPEIEFEGFSAGAVEDEGGQSHERLPGLISSTLGDHQEKELAASEELDLNLDLPFDFNGDQGESVRNEPETEFEPDLKTDDSGSVELELDMDDEESLDQILADLESSDLQAGNKKEVD
ncbi:MAG: hypothetical protein GXO34_00325 [Deltaproteobacteria bacterium]|nr:hypothetical protein [Deltaproteobacteria bacterium]